METMTISEFSVYKGIHRPGIYKAIEDKKIDYILAPFPRGKIKVDGVTCRKEVIINERADSWNPNTITKGDGYEKEMPNGVTYYGVFGLLCAEFNNAASNRVPAGEVNNRTFRKKGRTYYFSK